MSLRPKPSVPRPVKGASMYDAINCGAAVNFCRSTYSVPFRATGIYFYFDFNLLYSLWVLGLNVYDISKPCEGGPSDLCYPQTRSGHFI